MVTTTATVFYILLTDAIDNVTTPIPIRYASPATPVASDNWKTALAIAGGIAMDGLVGILGLVGHYSLRNRRPAIKPITIPSRNADLIQLLNAARGPPPTVVAATTSTTPDTQPTHTPAIEQGQSRASWTRGNTATIAKVRAFWHYLTTGGFPMD